MSVPRFSVLPWNPQVARERAASQPLMKKAPTAQSRREGSWPRRNRRGEEAERHRDQERHAEQGPVLRHHEEEVIGLLVLAVIHRGSGLERPGRRMVGHGASSFMLTSPLAIAKSGPGSNGRIAAETVYTAGMRGFPASSDPARSSAARRRSEPAGPATLPVLHARGRRATRARPPPGPGHCAMRKIRRIRDRMGTQEVKNSPRINVQPMNSPNVLPPAPIEARCRRPRRTRYRPGASSPERYSGDEDRPAT